MRTRRNFLLRAMALAVIGMTISYVFTACGPKVLPASGPHPALTPELVKIYQEQPKKYEQLGLMWVPVTPAMKWDENGDSTLGFETLKAQAAAKGANGVLLMADPGQYDMTVGAGYKGTFYRVPIKKEPRTAVVQAIFVLEE